MTLPDQASERAGARGGPVGQEFARVRAGAAWDRALLELDAEPSLLQSAGHAEVQLDEGWLPVGAILPSGSRAMVLIAGPPGLRRGYVPFGPVPATIDAIRELVAWAREAGLVRLRVQPPVPLSSTPDLLALGFRLGPSVTPGTGRRYSRYLYPEHTRVVPLGDPEAMLRACKPKHRYNIRLALRRGVEVSMTDDVEELHRQQLATASRQGIVASHPEVYGRRVRALAWCHIYVARVGREAVGAIMVARFGTRAYYLFGGTTGTHHELMPAYALQWQAMIDAAAAGCRSYDLFGVPPTDDPDHPWHGLWRFKAGFGGRVVSSPGAVDIVLRSLRAPFAIEYPRLSRAGLRRLAEHFRIGNDR